MGSELNNSAVGPDAARRLPRGAGVRGAGVRAAGAFGGGSAVSGLAGSNVTPCETGSLPSIVASASRLRAAPQEEQKRPSAEFLAPQEEQSMGRRDSIIGPACDCELRDFNEYAGANASGSVLPARKMLDVTSSEAAEVPALPIRKQAKGRAATARARPGQPCRKPTPP
jgi:hypothetical protein